MTEKRQTSQGYIIRILQHFAPKLRNITNFVMLFQAVMKFLSRLVKIKISLKRGKVYYTINASFPSRNIHFKFLFTLFCEADGTTAALVSACLLSSISITLCTKEERRVIRLDLFLGLDVTL
jgi:hypothetical protein